MSISKKKKGGKGPIRLYRRRGQRGSTAEIRPMSARLIQYIQYTCKDRFYTCLTTRPRCSKAEIVATINPVDDTCIYNIHAKIDSIRRVWIL